MEADLKAKREQSDKYVLDKYFCALESYFLGCEEEYRIKFQFPVEFVVIESVSDYGEKD